jgi:hypothetical protein
MQTDNTKQNASIYELKRITGISYLIAQKMTKKREEKWFPLTFEDLQLMSDIPNILWIHSYNLEKSH